jgi:hypothetical protein
MKIISAFLLIFFLQTNAYSQEIINLVFVGKNGITESIKEAHSFIVVKKYPDGFKRLDYTVHAPLLKLKSYSDSLLTVLQGAYYEYAPDGAIAISGYYENNAKHKDWYTYDDTGKVILIEKYNNGTLIETINPDTVKKDTADKKLKPGEKEAGFRGGAKSWIKYLTHNLNADLSEKSVKGGTLKVAFRVDTEGKCVDVFLRKSVEFVLDEEGMRIIETAPLWEPAMKDGEKVNAYRIQPITFMKQ